jgi:hypothetical protein
MRQVIRRHQKGRVQISAVLLMVECNWGQVGSAHTHHARITGQ